MLYVENNKDIIKMSRLGVPWIAFGGGGAEGHIQIPPP
jgi:hypothetical protein